MLLPVDKATRLAPPYAAMSSAEADTQPQSVRRMRKPNCAQRKLKAVDSGKGSDSAEPVDSDDRRLEAVDSDTQALVRGYGEADAMTAVLVLQPDSWWCIRQVQILLKDPR